MVRDRPIGVFDSGVGGLTVVREIMAALPHEEIIYYADTAHVPYGPRPRQEIESFAAEITGFLVDQGVKAVCMACNMSSALALQRVAADFDLPVFGVILPGAAAAVEASRNGRIGVLATEGTVKSKAYEKAILDMDPRAVVRQMPCPLFVPLVESDGMCDPACRETVAACVLPLLAEGVDTLVLGCTHYPFLEKQIRELAGDAAVVVDPAERTVFLVGERLAERALLSRRTSKPKHVFYASGDDASLRRLLAREFGLTDPDVRKVCLEREHANDISR